MYKFKQVAKTNYGGSIYSTIYCLNLTETNGLKAFAISLSSTQTPHSLPLKLLWLSRWGQNLSFD